MKAGLAAAAVVVACVLVAPASALALDLKLHPVSNGKYTHANWLGNVGEPDATGSASQALRLADGQVDENGSAAIIRGAENVPVRELTGFSYEYRKDGRCSKTDPRWTLFVEGKSGKHYVVSLGCATSAPSSGSTPGWIKRTAAQSFIRLEVMRKGGTDAFAGNLTGLALAYDQTVGSILLDNITVQTRRGSQTWTSAADNGNDPVGTDRFSDEELAFLALPLSLDELTYVDDLLASATPEEWAAIQDDPTLQP